MCACMCACARVRVRACVYDITLIGYVSNSFIAFFSVLGQYSIGLLFL